MEYSNLFVCLMGIGTVFVGLVCIVVLVIGMSAICRKLGQNPKRRRGYCLYGKFRSRKNLFYRRSCKGTGL